MQIFGWISGLFGVFFWIGEWETGGMRIDGRIIRRLWFFVVDWRHKNSWPGLGEQEILGCLIQFTGSWHLPPPGGGSDQCTFAETIQTTRNDARELSFLKLHDSRGSAGNTKLSFRCGAKIKKKSIAPWPFVLCLTLRVAGATAASDFGVLSSFGRFHSFFLCSGPHLSNIWQQRTADGFLLRKFKNNTLPSSRRLVQKMLNISFFFWGGGRHALDCGRCTIQSKFECFSLLVRPQELLLWRCCAFFSIENGVGLSTGRFLSANNQNELPQMAATTAAKSSSFAYTGDQ